jgi:protein-L-isoaspartate(D-aspartate) O-methyltransferase
VKAFATVARESFLGRGPRHILGPTQLGRGYTKSSDADPKHLSHNVLVAIDVRRELNNGHPSFLASLIDQLKIKDGETVYHVGCGTGYYSAIMAKLVGRDGRVVAVEVDKAISGHVSDSRWGETDYLLSNIRRVEPPEDLFVVPADYMIEYSGPPDEPWLGLGLPDSSTVAHPLASRRWERTH